MARLELSELVAPGCTAIVTQECQGGVVGPDAGLVELSKEARREAIPNIARLLTAARSAGVLGANHNARIFIGARRSGIDLSPGSPGASLLPELGPEPTDMVLTRWHGAGPMGGTDLDAVLRNLGVTTIVATGVSVNIAVTSLVMDAVNHGYQVVLPCDAVAGIPADYASAVITNTLSLLATVTSTDALIATWQGSAEAH